MLKTMLQPRSKARAWCWLVAALIAGPATAATYSLPADNTRIIGEIRHETVQEGETLLDIGRRNGLGYQEMQRANPELDMWVPEPGTVVTLPTRHILPDAPREGVVLNVAELRLYYFPPAGADGERVVETYPVSIGKAQFTTPLASTVITQKLKNPSWYPPASVRKVAAEEGRELPAMIPAGPDNPIGAHALRLDIPGYFIHGTNEPWGVGMRITHGCVRMYPENIEELFGRVPVGTRVQIVNQPYKAAWHEGELYLEAHVPLEEDRIALEEGRAHAFAPALDVVAKALRESGRRVDYHRVREVIDRHAGIPQAISRVAELSGAH